MRACAACLGLTIALVACKQAPATPVEARTTGAGRDARTEAVVAPTDATAMTEVAMIDGAMIDAAPVAVGVRADAAGGLNVCAAIDAVFAAQDQHLSPLIAPDGGSTVQLAGARARIEPITDDGKLIGGRWTAHLDRPSVPAVKRLIAET